MVDQRIHDDQSPMPQPPNPRLNAADTKVIDDWVAAGGPPGAAGQTCRDAGPLPDSGPPTLSCATDLTFAPATPWAMPSSTDDVYVCYGFDAPAGSIPAGTTRHVLGITPNVVNDKIVHHVLLYQANSAVSATPAPCDPAGSIDWRIAYGWAPGGVALKTPDQVGFPYDETTHWVVQIHYNNVNHLANQTDTSGFALCTTDQPVKYDADVVAFGTQSGIDVKPHSAQDITCSVTIPSLLGSASLHVFAAFPHEHILGKGIDTKIYPASGGPPVDIGDNTPWNFNNQLWFPVDGVVNVGDTVKTRCQWQNDTDTEVKFGYYTADEMCFSFTAYYPKVTSPVWSWDIPALQSSCAPTPDGGI
jgi:hypothetical protein